MPIKGIILILILAFVVGIANSDEIHAWLSSMYADDDNTKETTDTEEE